MTPNSQITNGGTGISITGQTSLTGNITGAFSAAAAAANQYNYNTTSIGVIAQPISTIHPSIISSAVSRYTITGGVTPPSPISISNSNNKEIVRLNKDGSVTWADEISIDEAAIAFSKSLQLGAERCAGITAGVKQRMRDTVFEEMIELAKIKGTITADDLTYMLSAAKIVDKLKGGYE